MSQTVEESNNKIGAGHVCNSVEGNLDHQVTDMSAAAAGGGSVYVSEGVDGPVEDISAVLDSPQGLAALQEKMQREQEKLTKYNYGNFHPLVSRRIKALKRIQCEGKHLLSDFYKEVMDLEIRYSHKFDEIYAQRYDIIHGSHEPTDEESSWLTDDDDDESNHVPPHVDTTSPPPAPPTGIPAFWLTVLKNTDMLADMVHECDEKILEHLEDVRVVNIGYNEENPDIQPGFALHFIFSENEYFTNHVLTKTYVMNYDPPDHDPLSFVGPEIIDHNGCHIDWYPGKNVTVKRMKKTQKNKQSGDTRLLHVNVANESFFTFFNTREKSSDSYEGEEEEAADLQRDFEVAHFIKDSLVPNAILYFTGEVYDYDDDEFDDDDDEMYGGNDDAGDDTAAAMMDNGPLHNDGQEGAGGAVDCKQQ